LFSIMFMSLKTASESSGSSRFVSHSVAAGDVTRPLPVPVALHNGIAVEAEEFEDDVDELEADCGNSWRLLRRCLIVPALSLANGI